VNNNGVERKIGIKGREPKREGRMPPEIRELSLAAGRRGDEEH